MNIDVGGGTSKIAVCRDGKVVDLTALDVGARLVVTDSDGRIQRLEEAGRQFGAELGWKLTVGSAFTAEQGERLAAQNGGAPVRGGTRRLAEGGHDAVAAPRSDGTVAQKSMRSPSPVACLNSSMAKRKAISAISGRSLRKKSAIAIDCLGTETGAAHRRHPRHGDRRIAIHDPGERQHDSCLADGDSSPAQCAGDRAGAGIR